MVQIGIAPAIPIAAAFIVLMAMLLVFAVVLLFRGPRRQAGGLLIAGTLMLLVCLMVPGMLYTFSRHVPTRIAQQYDDSGRRLTRSLTRLEKMEQDARDRAAAVQRQMEHRITVDRGIGHVVIRAANVEMENMKHQVESTLQDAAAAKAEAANALKAVDALRSAAPDKDTEPAASAADSVATTDGLARVTDIDPRHGIDDPFTPEVDQEWDSTQDQEYSDTAPADSVTAPAIVDQNPAIEKPEWIYETTVSTAQEPHRLTVRCGPYNSIEEVEQHMDETLRKGALRYAEWYLSANGKQVHNFGDLLRLQMPLGRLRECVAATYDEVHLSDVSDVEPMPLRYLLLEFDADFRRQVIDVYWQQSVSVARSLQAGLGGMGLFATLGVVLGAVKIDALTRGQHRAKICAAAGLLATTALLTFSACGIYFGRG